MAKALVYAILILVTIAVTHYSSYRIGRAVEVAKQNRLRSGQQLDAGTSKQLRGAAAIMSRLGTTSNNGLSDPDEFELISATNQRAIEEWLDDYKSRKAY